MNKKINTGNAGEFFVAGELARRGFTVALPTAKVENIDLLAMKPGSFRQIAIQVKTAAANKSVWPLSQKNEALIADNYFYVFVSLNGFEPPHYHVVPSNKVADFISENNRRWLSHPKKNGEPRKESTLRHFADDSNSYLNRWDLLK